LNTILRDATPSVTWEQLVLRDRRLLAATTVNDVARLVGWTANTTDLVLRSSEAYHVALDHVLTTASLGRCA
jgi:hypothetical protein